VAGDGREGRSKWHSTAREAVDIRQQIPVTAGLRVYYISIQAHGIPPPMSGGMPEDSVDFRCYFFTHPPPTAKAAVVFQFSRDLYDVWTSNNTQEVVVE
jgi:hypothetical protein